MKSRVSNLTIAITRALGAGVIASLAGTAAHAQQTQAIEKIEVTGSNLKRIDAETASPVQVITADDLKKSGYTSVSDVLRNITANGQGTLSQSFSQAFAAGASGIALRGLTVGATLVLIDGHRVAPYPLSDDGQRPFVDISNIPFDAVERIEVLKDGASAVYGSDAIAGVVNVILKKTYVGTNLSAEVGTSQEGGGTTTHASIIHGMGDLAKDGYNGFVTFEYRNQDQIKLSQRSGKPWTNTDWTSQGGLNLTPGAVNVLNGGTPVLRTPYLYSTTSTTGTSDPNNYAFYPGCNFTAMNANACTYKNQFAQLQPKTQNLNLMLSGTKRLGADWQIGVKASVFDSKSQQIVGDSPTVPNATYQGNIAIGPGVAPTVVGAIPNFTVPAGYPGNTLGGPANIYGRLTDLGASRTDIDSKTYRVVADLSGNIGAWDLSASAGHTSVATTQTYSNAVNETALFNALNDPTNPYSLAGGNSSAVNSIISPTFSGKQRDDLDFIETRASRDLMQLSGGALSFGTGLSFLHKKLNAPAAELIANGTVSGNSAYAMGQQNDSAVYVEFNAPVFKSLELDGAARIDHYNTYGNSTTPKFGFKYKPLEQIAFRGTLSRGFRAPGPAENGTAGSAFMFNAINDPVLCADGNANTAGNAVAFCSFNSTFLQTTTKNLQPEKSKSGTLGLILEPVKGWSTTLDYYNIQIDNQIVSASSLASFVPSYVRGTPQIMTFSDGAGGTFQQMSSVGPILYAQTGYVNANTTKTSGLELDTRYKFNLGAYGNLTADFQYTYMLSYKLTANGTSYELAGTHGPVIVSGDTGNPRSRAQFTLSYDMGPLNIASTTNWISSYNVTDPSLGWTTCSQGINNVNSEFFGSTPPTQYCKVASFLTTDLTVQYKLGNHWTMHATVLNALNRQPPIDLATYGGVAGTPYNPSLAQAGAVGRFFNIGAAYRF